MEQNNIPNHIAIIMDGNGRWAKSRSLPRIAGHKQGAEAARNIVKHCMGMIILGFARKNQQFKLLICILP
jgi:undecaprenyl diphosphate synthase